MVRSSDKPAVPAGRRSRGVTTSEVRELSQPDRGRRRALAQKQRPASAARRETVWEFVVAGYEHELIAQKLGVRRRPITTEAIGSAATHPSLRGALATKQSRSHNMRGASNPNDRTAAPGLLPATRVRGRNDGQGIGSLVSACRLSLATVRREVDKAIDRLDAPDRHIHPTSPNLETAPCAVDDALERADLNAADPPLQGDGAVERHHGPTVAAPSRSQPPQLSSLERGGKLSCPQSLENTQNRKIHETAPGAVDDALERADLDPADPPLAGDALADRAAQYGWGREQIVQQVGRHQESTRLQYVTAAWTFNGSSPKSGSAMSVSCSASRCRDWRALIGISFWKSARCSIR